jgi:hypothetical protein
VSVRRHALLVDYPMHDGCNARAWLQLEVNGGFVLPQAGIRFLTQCAGVGRRLPSGSKDLDAAMAQAPLVFEPMHDMKLEPAHNELPFHTWGDKTCCLPRGATGATLKGSFPLLEAGQALLFEEILGPRTGEAADADMSHRHVVRLTSVKPKPPAILKDPLDNQEITEIAWGIEDALPFPLCISSRTDEEHGSKYLDKVSVARGNLVLVDHGATVAGEALGEMPAPILFAASPRNDDFCHPAEPEPVPVRFHPGLRRGPLTQSGTVPVKAGGSQAVTHRPFDPDGSAASAGRWRMADVQPSVRLSGQLAAMTSTWQARRTLLHSEAGATDFVVEVEDGGEARLRFGDGVHGQRPRPGTLFTATYRVGNGSAGNVGAGAIAHVVGPAGVIAGVEKLRNPLPAAGGRDPEPLEEVRRNAPEAFRTQERAVTPEDYAEVTQRHAGVARAAASLRWTGSWHTVFTTVDPMEGVDAVALERDLESFVERYRMAGHDLEFDAPRYVPLEVAMHVCVEPDYFRSHVRAALMDLFSARSFPDGRRGLFHPDNLTFGQTVYLSSLYAAAHGVPGVASARITTFRRQGIDDPAWLLNGQIPLERLEIARLDNSPNFPERGVLKLDLNGGK